MNNVSLTLFIPGLSSFIITKKSVYCSVRLRKPFESEILTRSRRVFTRKHAVCFKVPTLWTTSATPTCELHAQQLFKKKQSALLQLALAAAARASNGIKACVFLWWQAVTMLAVCFKCRSAGVPSHEVLASRARTIWDQFYSAALYKFGSYEA
jgi:hypothetical protein